MEITEEHQKLLLGIVKTFEDRVMKIYADKDAYRKSLMEFGIDFMELQKVSDSDLDDGLIALNDSIELLKADLSLISQQNTFTLRVFMGIIDKMIPRDDSQYESEWDIHWDIMVLLTEYYKLSLNITLN